MPSLLRLWFAAGVVTFAGSENMILNMVHVVETLASTTNRGVSWDTDVLYQWRSCDSRWRFTVITLLYQYHYRSVRVVSNVKTLRMMMSPGQTSSHRTV